MSNWQDYIPEEQAEQDWELEKPGLFAQFNYENIPEGEYSIRQFWEQKNQEDWDKGMDWRYLYMRTDRPGAHRIWEDLIAIIDCCHIHLDDCFTRQMKYTDLVDKSESLDGKGYNCVKCKKVISSNSESTVFCPRCCRQELPNNRKR